VDSPETAKHPREVLGVLLLACMTYALAQTLVVPAIPEIAEQTGSSSASASWLLTGFLLAAAISTPIAGKLGDVYGKGVTLAAVMGVFALGSVVCALATTLEPLIAGRVLQGVAGGVFPLAFGIVRDTFPPRLVPGGLAIVSTLFGIGAGLGLPLSGVIVEHAGIAWMFWLCLAMSLPAAAAALALIPRYDDRAERVRVDWIGALLLSLALAAVLLGLTQANGWGWGSPPTVGLIAGGLALLAVWVAVEARQREPLIELGVLRQRSVAATNLAALCIGVAMFVSFLLVPQLAQSDGPGGLGLSITDAGLLILPTALVQLVMGPVAGAVGARIGFRATLVVGAACCAAALAMLVVEHDRIWDFLVSGMLIGMGIAFAYASMANLIVDAVPQWEVGIATGINTVTRTVGGALGVAVATALVASGPLHSSSGGGGDGYGAAFALAAGFGVLAMVAALAIPRDPTRPAEASPEPAKMPA
jgi:EmrB/QacA subfamily drug resistance transporter